MQILAAAQVEAQQGLQQVAEQYIERVNQAYSKRAKMAEVVLAASACRTTVTEA